MKWLPTIKHLLKRTCAAVSYRVLNRQRAGKLALATGRVLCSRRFVVCMLSAAIALELCLLGTGVARKLELASEKALQAAEAERAAYEARAFAQAQGFAGIGAAPGTAGEAGNGVHRDNVSSVDHNAPPPLPARDVSTLIADLTGEELDEVFSEPGTEPVAPDSPGNGSSVAAAPTEASTDTTKETPLTHEQAGELDRLIRKGVSALTAGDMRLCILSLEQARVLAPNHPALLYYYGMAYDKLLNPGKAREFYTKVFQMRDKAGKYFERASRRLSFGFEQPSAMRGKLAFGPHLVRHTYDDVQGDMVRILLPILLAPGEEIARPDDIYITLQFFDLVNGRKIEFSRIKPTLAWLNDKPTWEDNEEALSVTYNMPPLTQEEIDAYGTLQYYGFTAKLYYKGEPLDCISLPSALILQEQRLNSRRYQSRPASGLLPDDGLDPAGEEATPFSEFLEEIDPSD